MGQRLALIIGNSEYHDTNLARLVTPGEDASDLAEILRDPAIGSFDEVTALVNQPASTIRRAIACFFDKKRCEDLLLLYFSGHGVRDDRGNLYLAANDTERDLLSGTAIPAAFITDEMDRSRSRRQVLILDCCHSGAFARGAKGVLGASVGTAAAFEGTGYGRIVLTATDSTQYAWEGDRVVGEAENSVFTHYLIQGLWTGEADADADGWVTLDELYDYVYERVVNETPRQTPGKWAYKQQGEIVIARNPRLVVKPAELPVELQRAIASPFAEVRADAVHELDRLLRSSDEALALAVYAALTRLTDDGSRRVSILAAESLAAYAETQRVREEAKTKAGQPAAKETKAETEHPAGTLLPRTMGRGIVWAFGGLFPLLVISLIGGAEVVEVTAESIGWTGEVVKGAIGGTIGAVGGVVTGLTLGRTGLSITWKQILAVAVGWAIGWAIGGAISLSSGWIIAGAIIGAIGASGAMLWAPLTKLLRRALVWTYDHLVAIPKLLRQTPVWTYGRLSILILLLLGFFGPWTITQCSGPTTLNGEPPPITTITWTGVDVLVLSYLANMVPLVAPVIFLFIATLLRLGPRRLRNSAEIIWMERIGVAASLVSIGFLLKSVTKILWGLWTTVTGVLLALLNLIGELIATRRRRR